MLRRGEGAYQRPPPTTVRDLRREKVVRLGPLLKSDRITLVFEAIRDDQVRVGCASWDDGRLSLRQVRRHQVAFRGHSCTLQRLLQNFLGEYPMSP